MTQSHIQFITGAIAVSFLSVAVLPDCGGGSRDGQLSDRAILKAAFVGETQPPDAKLLLKRRANLDEDAAFETVALVSFGDSERLVFLKEQAGGVKQERRLDFHLARPGAYDFVAGSGWVRRDSSQKPGGSAAVGRIVRRVQIGTIEQKKGPASVMLEYLTDHPGRGRLESHLLVFTGFTKSYDSLVALADHPLLAGTPRVSYAFNKDHQLIIFPEDAGYQARLRWNGRELLVWYPGEPLFTFLPLRINETKDGTEYTLQIRNDGGPALLSYISLTFPEGSKVVPLGKNPARLHNQGSNIHARGGRRIAAKAPLLEATVRGWRSFHRTTLKFRATTPPADRSFTVRVVARSGTDNRLSPPDISSVTVVRDQQGYPAYLYSLVSGQSAVAAPQAPSNPPKAGKSP